MREMVKRFSAKGNGFVKVLIRLCSGLCIQSEEIVCKVVQRHTPMKVVRRQKSQCFSGDDNGFIRVLH